MLWHDGIKSANTISEALLHHHSAEMFGFYSFWESLMVFPPFLPATLQNKTKQNKLNICSAESFTSFLIWENVVPNLIILFPHGLPG